MAARTQMLIFNLLGDYLHPRRRAVPTSGLLAVLAALGVSERAARSTLSRMRRRGWLRSERVGRRSQYRLTQRGVALLEEGDRRIFGKRPTHWNGYWHIVTYSLPKRKRAERRQLRSGLAWLGYGMLVPGTMIAAQGRREQVRARIEELKLQGWVHSFSHASLGLAHDKDLVDRCWDLAGLNRAYGEFVERHRPKFEDLNDAGGRLSDEESFARRFWFTFEYSSFPLRDPYLPPELLPMEWKGYEAAILFSAFRELLRGPAQAFIDAQLGLERKDEPLLPERRLLVAGSDR